MANDRLRIVCKFCGESKMLFKFYPCKTDCCQDGKIHLRGYCGDENILDEFMSKHIYGETCGNRHHKFDLNGEEVFRLETENKK